MPDGEPAEAGEEECAPSDEDCIEGKKEAKAFKIMGIQAWIRTFNGPINLISFLPQVISWERAKKGHAVAAGRFVWFTKWWSQISGWVTSLATIYLSMDYLLGIDLSPGRGKRKLMKGKKGGKGDDAEDTVY